jgi:hypothetical protein
MEKLKEFYKKENGFLQVNRKGLYDYAVKEHIYIPLFMLYMAYNGAETESNYAESAIAKSLENTWYSTAIPEWYKLEALYREWASIPYDTSHLHTSEELYSKLLELFTFPAPYTLECSPYDVWEFLYRWAYGKAQLHRMLGIRGNVPWHHQKVGRQVRAYSTVHENPKEQLKKYSEEAQKYVGARIKRPFANPREIVDPRAPAERRKFTTAQIVALKGL